MEEEALEARRLAKGAALRNFGVSFPSVLRLRWSANPHDLHTVPARFTILCARTKVAVVYYARETMEEILVQEEWWSFSNFEENSLETIISVEWLRFWKRCEI